MLKWLLQPMLSSTSPTTLPTLPLCLLVSILFSQLLQWSVTVENLLSYHIRVCPLLLEVTSSMAQLLAPPYVVPPHHNPLTPHPSSNSDESLVPVKGVRTCKASITAVDSPNYLDDSVSPSEAASNPLTAAEDKHQRNTAASAQLDWRRKRGKQPWKERWRNWRWRWWSWRGNTKDYGEKSDGPGDWLSVLLALLRVRILHTPQGKMR